jgi:cbb3-type cytochrome oxidase maturation protein
VEVLILLVFVSLTLAALAVGMFTWLIGQRTFDHAERLMLLPIDERGETTTSDPEEG